MRSIENTIRGLALAAALGAAITPSLCRASDDDIKALAKAYNGFGQDVFTVLEREPGNIVFSPYSVGVAMAMTMSGARGDTQSEMLSAMRFTQTQGEIEGANAPLAAGLRSYAKQLPAQPSPREICAKMNMSQPGCIKAVTAAWKPPAAPTRLEIANALMITPRGVTTKTVSDAYASLLRKQYNAELFRNSSLKEVNDWASHKTKGKIPSLLQQLDPDVIAVILNAVYFNGTWEAPFDSKLTKDAPFTLGSGEAIQAPTMQAQKRFALHEGEGFKAVRLPYQTPELGMIVVLPDDAKGLATVAAKLDADGLPKLLDEMDRARPALLDLKLPRFKVQYGRSLKEPMQLAGVRLAFDEKQANFAGMAGTRVSPGIYIDDVIHQATIEVSEEGTVASAATAVMPTWKSAPPIPTPFVADHPFLFYIVDRNSGAVLFQGRIEDPRQSTAS